MSTDSESHSLTDKASRNSATYSICSLDEVPVRKSAVQIIRERSSTDLLQPGSPRRKGTMQITKLVLKDPPTSPKRTKVTPMVIKSIKTFTSSALIAENGQILNDHSNKQKDQLGPSGEEEYRITPLPQVNAGRLLEEFEAKKNERNLASNEFQNYLLESFNKENRPKTGIEISKATTVTTSAGSANSIQQSGSDKGKSDSSVTTNSSSSQQTASSSTSASKSEQKSEDRKEAAMPEKTEELGCTKPASVRRSPRPKTVDSKKSIPEPKKEKSYDPQKAREFIKEQQAKRKQEKKATTPQMSDKDLIKKRLEDLKKNTQVLVSKNVQKTRKRSFSASGASSQKSGNAPLKAVESNKLPPTKTLKKSSSISSLKTVAVVSTKSDSAKSSAGSRESRRRSSLLKANLSEHMGIMRKPDAVALEEVMMSPLRIRTPPRPVHHPEVITPVRPVEPNESIRNVQEKSVSAIEQELKLDVPEVKLVPDSTVKHHEPPSVEKKEFKPVPPWLKHTLLQPDPYPFIMAVRKKLEAIRNLNQNQTAHPDESVIPRKHEETVKRSETANSQKCLEYLETLKSVPYVHKPSESDQNISSVSLQHSDSNTTSEISSIKSDFILPLPPLSSTKFDSTQPATRETHHPKVGPISPLSMDRISNLKITANSSTLERSINFHRGDHMPGSDLIPDRISFNNRNVHDLRQSQLSLNTSEKQRDFLQKPLEKSTKELEYQKMLEAFNRSLTQVIEVNQQLYSALNKPPESLPPERIKIRDGMTQTTPVPSVANASANSNYSEDFERSDDLKPSNPPPDSTESTPEKKSSSELTTSTSTPSSSSTTAPQSTTSPDDSPSGKTQSSEQSQLLDSRSLSLSDSHNTNPPMPEEYLPSFEESLRQRQQPSPPKATEINPGNSSTSIETQISDEAPDEGKNVLRETIETESKSLESISMKLSEASEVLNEQSPPKEAEVEILKAASSSSADDSELEAIEMEKGTAMNDTTMGSDIMAVFNRTDMEVSIMSTTISEANLSYSSIGLYDQLIQTEKCKGEQLAAHARLKEKALLNRTKGQLAWLELQKQRYRERGMMEQISVIKKKQRAILMRLEKERADLNRLKKSSSEMSSRTSAVRSPMTPKSLEKLNSFSSHSSNSISLRRNSGGSGKGDGAGINASLVVLGDLSTSTGAGGDNRLHQRRRTVTTTTTTTISNSQLQLTAAIRGMELEPSESLEDILQRREQELQKRRQHVQTLLEWHQKLDREEQEILDIERNFLQYNQRKITESRAADEQTLSRIRTIEKSLQTLQQIPDKPHGSKSSDDDGEEVQAVGGSKLNRLWYRLTGVKENRYEPARSYTLTKAILESLYEEAKQQVLEGFRENEGMRKVLLEQSMSGLNSSASVGKDVSGISDQRNTSSEQVHTTVESSEGNSFQTTVNSAELAQESANPSAKLVEEEESKTDEQIEERSSLLDVEEIISRVSDITENINGFLSSTTNIDELLQQEEQEKQLSDSVEFHTIEDEQDSGSQTKPSSDTYSVTFDIPTIEANRLPLSAEDNQLMIEDTSLPPMMNDDSLLNDESIAESIPESAEKPTEEIPDDVSLEEASSTASSATTPTTAEETETEYNDVLIGKSPAKDSTASELEKRLITLNENLGELNESIERVSAIRSPEVPKSERQNSSESESVTPPVIEEEYSTDMDFTAEDRRSSTESADAKPFLDDIQALKVPQNQLTEDSDESHKIEIKIRNINANENFPHPSTVGVPSTSGVSSFSYLTPPAHGPSTSTQTTVIQNRMPDIINEAEVLRRQQLQIEQEIKQLEQQVVFFREIPNKPPPPYIPPANGSPLALIFPPESRINDLIETRTKELYLDEPAAEMLGSDHVTNIYEKLILDMCKELFTDVRPPSPDVSFRTVRHEKRPLAFYNPPDRLVCLQSYMKQKIKRILNEDSLLQQQQHQLNLHHCPMPFLMFAGSSAKRKRDQVDEILAQEMFDEEARWTNFDREEIEVKERIVEEVTKMLVEEAVRDMDQVWKEKNAGKQEESNLQDGKVEELN
ncbi:centrosome-associated protein 350-like [Ochlerotatus camptorhynchus]|uniref:centrosome-associated protein 350-like n=1 Tax=Ochlerotatus camptorhynchus TaxID=644619 RepID=UPI0031D5E7E0